MFQARFFISYLDDKIVLPTIENMKLDFEKDIKKFLSRGKQWRHYYALWERQWDYYNEIATITKTPPIPKVIFDLYNITTERLIFSCGQFKGYEYLCTPDGKVIEVLSSTGQVVNTRLDIWKLRIRGVYYVLTSSFPQVVKLILSFLFLKLKGLIL